MTDDLITRLYGERCVDHDDNCCVCVVWDMRDRIEALTAENDRLKREVMLQMGWKTEAQNDVDQLAMTLDNIANESSDTWARDKARAALTGDGK